MEIHGFTLYGSIDATLEGVRMIVPNDPANRHRQMIAEWEAAGNTIPSYTPTTINPLTIPLKPYQFWGVVRATGREQNLTDWVAAIPDQTQRGLASAMLEFSLEFRRDHPLMEQARQALNMTEEELNGLWEYASTL